MRDHAEHQVNISKPGNFIFVRATIASVVFFVGDAFTRVPDGIKQIRLLLADAAPIILQFLTSALDARLRLAVLP
jgi:hypothetical protein